MKRLNRYLLTHYPLVWNMRLHWIIPVLLVLHLLFFLAGLAEPQRLSQFDYRTTTFQGAATSLAVLVGLLAVIGWLVFYLRNNAFKSFYPVRNDRLFMEFLAGLAVIGLASTISISHQLGRYQRLRALTRDIDLVHEANTTALAFHFLPFEGARFENYNSCDSQRVQDSLYTTPTNGGPPPERVEMYGPDSTVERSYLHYCSEPSTQYYIPESLDRYGVDSIAKRWLFAGDRDSVRATLAVYIALVKKYGGSARFDVDRHAAAIFSTPRFLVREGPLQQYPDQPGTIERDHITTSKVDEALRAVVDIRGGVLTSELVLFYLYWSFGAALLLFTYRITRLRTWFGAGVGVGVWVAIFAVMAAVTQNEDGPMLAFIFVAVAAIVYAAINISRRRRKTSSGFAFLWGTWSLLVLVPLIIFYIRNLSRRTEYRYDARGNMTNYDVSPVATWIDGHSETIGFLNLLLVLALLAVYIIPQARRWQAAPEE